MPNYKYACPCGENFSVWTSIVDYKPTQPCPNCGAQSPRNTEDFGCSSIWKCDGAYGKTSNS